MLRRTLLSQFLMLLGSSILRTSSAEGMAESDTTSDAVRQLANAADELLRALQPESRKELEFSFDDVERRKWSNVPNAVQPRRGLALGRMSDSERIAAHRLLRAITSTQGYLKATGIMGLENVLHEIQAPDLREYFSPDFYFLSFFGRPGAAAVCRTHPDCRDEPAGPQAARRDRLSTRLSLLRCWHRRRRGRRCRVSVRQSGRRSIGRARRHR